MHCLNESYGHVLDLILQENAVRALPSVEELHTVAVDSDEGPRQLTTWTDAAVRPVLTFTKAYQRLHEGTALRFVASGPTIQRQVASIVPQLPLRTTIDNAIGLDNFAQQALVVGLSRTSARWKSGRLAHGPMNGDLWPLRQLANLCNDAKTRYGYIQTNDALVAVCFAQPIEGKGSVLDLHAQFMPVPWNTEHGTRAGTTLTTELALWWLCMLALADRPRGLEPVDRFVPIDAWIPTLLDDCVTWVDRHYYSMFDRPSRANVHFTSSTATGDENSTVAPTLLSIEDAPANSKNSSEVATVSASHVAMSFQEVSYIIDFK